MVGRVLLGIVVLLVVAQAVRPAKTNPPVTGVVDAPPDVVALLRRACWDCHSNETTWPWYAEVAPVSWLVVHDVSEGRRHLNLTQWNQYDAAKRTKKLGEVEEMVREGDMPLWYYVPLHRPAKLSDAERARIVSWAGAPAGGGAR